MIALVVALLVGQQADPGPPQAEIELAIKRGADALLDRTPGVIAGTIAFHFGEGQGFDPLLLYTLVHSGVPLDNAVLQQLLAKILAQPFHRTYQVALTAAALAAIDPLKYQDRLVQCAQYLVDFQCENGQWGYGEKVEFAASAAPAANRTVAAVKVKQLKKLGGAAGDNSNAQYAALGLKACASAWCEIDPAVINRAIDWWEKAQHKSGGWSYQHNGVVEDRINPYGSMTAGAVSSLIMLKQLKKWDPKASPAIKRGFAWLADNFTVAENPKQPVGLEDWRHYFLYAVERAGDLYPTEEIGKHRWYALGAAQLLKTQRADGTWIAKREDLVVADTCFALLFLERVARRPPVATGK